MDIAGQATQKTVRFYDNAALVNHGTETAIHLDGNKDYVNIGRLSQYDASDKMAFSIDFTRDAMDGSADKLVWNNTKIGLTLRGDGISVGVATANQGFKTYSIGNLGLNDTELHQAIVMIDAATDHLQVVVDDHIVLDVTGPDFLRVGAGEWMLGTPWNEFYQGEISDFRIGDRFEFLTEYVPPAATPIG